jgi:hypothetical protein
MARRPLVLVLLVACHSKQVSGSIILGGAVYEPEACSVSRCVENQCRFTFSERAGARSFTVLARTDGPVIAVEGKDAKRCGVATFDVEDDYPKRGRIALDCRQAAGVNEANVGGRLDFDACARE